MQALLDNKFKQNGLRPYGAVPNNNQMNWYKREAAAFFHYGVNTFTGAEWGDGTENESVFNPSEQDCRQWVYSIKKAGFTAAIITAKHHDGFCLWPSKYTQHSIKNSPYKNGKGDIVREFTDACREYGIKAGIYLSPWDRNCKFWATPEYDDYYVNQLTELYSNYGEIHECWWDGAGSTEAKYDWGRWAFTVKKLQPNCIIYGSFGATEYVDCRWVGNESGFAGKPCWGTLNPEALVVEDTKQLFTGHADGARFIPAEVDVSIRPGWFYHEEQNTQVRTPQNLIRLWFESSGRNASLLLNIPPTPQGLVHETDAQNLQTAADILRSTFAVNALQAAKVSCAPARSEACSAEKLLLADDSCFYAAPDDCLTPVIEFELPQEKTINCLIFSEVIELGHRVRGFEIDALVNGEWQNVACGECVGYRFAEYFPQVSTKKIRIKITQAAASPVLRFFGAYLLPQGSYGQNEQSETYNLTQLQSAKLTVNKNELHAEFGGIYPFNTVEFNGEGIGSYKIQAFNGVSFETVCEGTKAEKRQICRFERVSGAYQMKLIVDIENLENIELNVFDDVS